MPLLSSAVQLFCTIKAYLCCFTQFTVDQSKLTAIGSALSDTPNVHYLVALYHKIMNTINNNNGIHEEFKAIRRAISLNKTFVLFVEITTGDNRHTQQIHIDEPSMYHCPLVRLFKTGFPKCM